MTQCSISHIDTCLACYLTDHHNREGELLIGCAVSNETNIASLADDILHEISCCDEPSSEDVTDNMLRAAICDMLHSEDAFRDETIWDAKLPPAPDPDDSDYTLQAWFVLSWSDDETLGEYDSQGERTA